MNFNALITPYYEKCAICNGEDLIEKGHSICNHCRGKTIRGRCLDCGGTVDEKKEINGEPIRFCHWCLAKKIKEIKETLEKTLSDDQKKLLKDLELVYEYRNLASV